MKVTIYALHLGFGGVEKYVSTIASMLADKHDVEIVSTYKVQKDPAFYIDPRVKIEYLMDIGPNKDAMKNAIRRKNPLKILTEGIKAIKILVLKTTKNIASIKKCDSDVIISTRIFHNKLISKYAKKSIIKITGEHNHHNNNEKYINSVLESCSGFDYFIPISAELCSFYQDEMKSRGVETRYIRYCIDDLEIDKKLKFDNENLIFVGRLSQEKGVYELIDVFSMVLEKHSSAKLYVVGDGNERHGMEEAAKSLGIEKNVVFCGFRNKEYIYSLLPECAIYVMTSFTESFGIVLLEAMACGIPCVAYDSAQGAKEIIVNGKNGYLIGNRDKKAMVNCIDELLKSKDKLQDLSAGAKETATLFSTDNTKESWLNLMNEIECRQKI